MPLYRKKPVVIEAEQFHAERPLPFRRFNVVCYTPELEFHINTLEGPLHVTDGDWIICGVKGEFYPCKPDVFAETYEQVE